MGQGGLPSVKYTIVGGELSPAITIGINSCPPVFMRQVVANAKANKARGFPSYLERKHQRHLAVVGGGSSILYQVKTLRNWKGDVWAINGAWKWCEERGIKSTFFAADPDPIVLKWAEGATDAIIDVHCDPTLFDLLPTAHTFDTDDIDVRGSTATAAPYMAASLGMLSVTFFGCESSYTPKRSHAYQDENRQEQMLIECGGEDFLTAPDYYIQARELAGQIRAMPSHLFEESGGLLRALILNDEHWIKWVSEKCSLKP